MKAGKNKLLYISTNAIWSGSEELWLRSAAAFKKKGYKIYSVTRYHHSNVTDVNEFNQYYTTPPAYSLKERLLNKLRIKRLPQKNFLFQFIQQTDPCLVIISQGDNIGSLAEMEFCAAHNYPFITVTQLVTECFFLQVNEQNLQAYRSAYAKARKNFFVSENNLRLNNLMFSIELPNNEVVYNPCRVYGNTLAVYPSNEKYNIAIAGRVECFHKGLDILLEILSREKWQSRNVHFNFYGSGPHVDLLKTNIKRLNITNISLKGHTEDIAAIWKENHLLCMPSRMEGQALALIEAMYYARAAVVTNVGGATVLIQDGVNGFVADAATAESFASALENAWLNRDAWEGMGKIAHEVIMNRYEQPAEEYFNKQVEALIF